MLIMRIIETVEPSGLTIEVGDVAVRVPQSVEAEGAEAIDAYVADQIAQLPAAAPAQPFVE